MTGAVRQSWPWREATVVLGVAIGIAMIAAGMCAARVAWAQGYWAAGYHRLIGISLWHSFDRWAAAAVAVGLGLTVIRWAVGRHRHATMGDGAGRPSNRAVGVACAVLAVGMIGRGLALRDGWLTADGPSVLLISIDTLRADRLGTYGYGRSTSPAIDARLAAQGVTFETCFSQSPKTTPSHMTMLTSLSPSVHGIPLWEGSAPGPVLNPAVHTLAEVLKNAGYATAAFTGRGHMDRSRGFGQGFDVYRHGDQLRRAMRWLTRQRHRKVFVFFHTYAVHDPYVPPQSLLDRFDDEGYRGPVRDAIERLRKDVGGWGPAHRIFWASVDKRDPRDVRFVGHLYDGAIRHMDDSIITPLLDHLEVLGRGGDTLVVLTSDHGEAFGEHGAFLHDDLYTETLRVPLVLRFPGRLPPGRRVRAHVRVLDIMPTIVDLLGIQPPPRLQGRSLVPLVSEGAAGQEAWETVSEYNDASSGRVFESLRRGGLTYIVDGTTEQLFDALEDPGEHDDLATRRPADLHAMRAGLARWRAASGRLAAEFGPRGDVVAPSGETLRQLRALGYVE